MNNFLDNIPTLPLAPWVESAMDWLTSNFSAFFNSIQQFGKLLMNQVTDLLISIPAIILILLVVIFAFFVSGKKLGLAAFSLIGLLFIYNQGLWTHLMETTTLVIFSSIISIIIGIPLGILMSKSTVAENIIKPILDFMQTMPGFVYLIPAVAFFWYWYCTWCLCIRYLCFTPNCTYDKPRYSSSTKRISGSCRLLW